MPIPTDPCKKCKILFTVITLNKDNRNGVCGKCFNKSKKPHKTLKKKKNISAPMKQTVWLNEFGKKYDGLCPVCKIKTIETNDFHCGHILAESKGGNLEVNNLRPICAKCNTSMGSKHMNDYINELWAGREDEYTKPKEKIKDMKDINRTFQNKISNSLINTDWIYSHGWIEPLSQECIDIKDIKNMNELFYPIYRDFQNIIATLYTAWEMNDIYKIGNLDKIRGTNGISLVDKPLCLDFESVAKICKEHYNPSEKKIQFHDYAQYMGFVHVLKLMKKNIDKYNNMRSSLNSNKNFIEVKTINTGYKNKDDFRNNMLKCLYSQGGHGFNSLSDYIRKRELYEITQFDHLYENYMRVKL
jgi:5-methylcytosine-specific restriction endonuclease McrA